MIPREGVERPTLGLNENMFVFEIVIPREGVESDDLITDLQPTVVIRDPERGS